MAIETITNRIPSFLKGFIPGGNAADGNDSSPPGDESLTKSNLDLEALGIESIDAADFPEKPPLVNGLTSQQMQQWKVVPVEVNQEEVRVAMSDPLDIYLVELLEEIYQKKIRPVHASQEDILTVLYRWYEADSDMEAEEEDETSAIEDGLWDDPEQLRDLATEAPVVRLVNHVINQALEVKASDIHFEPFRDNLKIRFRIDGVLHDVETVSKKLQPAITSRLKLMAKMNIAEMRLPQDGRIKVKDGQREIDIRVSSLPTIFGESIVLRLLNRDEVKLELESLGIAPDILERFDRLIRRPYGMILVTGPTGSGKTTTLYSVMNRINSPDKKIVTVEDPVEYQLEGINQLQVKSGIGLTFASALRTILRQDPDVILIGEIRDRETAEIAVQSALTGHLVFSTLHTNDAASAITRLQEMGVESYLISSCLLAIMAQRLVRKICPHCREEYDLPSEFVAEAASALGVSEDEVPRKTWRGAGCPSCANTGYSGRTGIYELIEISEAIASLILNGENSSAISSRAQKLGMRTLRQDGLARVLEGVTTLEEVMRVTN